MSPFVPHTTRPNEIGEALASLFNLKIELLPDSGVASFQQLPDLGTRVVETYANVTCVPGLPNSSDTVLRDSSKLMRVQGALPGAQPDKGEAVVSTLATDGAPLVTGNFTGSAALWTSIHALLKADLFNLLCIPPYNADGSVEAAVLTAAATLCRAHRAFLVIDAPPTWGEVSGVNGIANTVGTDNARNAAIFFPRLRMPNPLRQNQVETFASCGAVAVVFARTDAQRGVWKAPAGLDAGITGVSALAVPLTDAENGQLNPLGVNCLRSMPGAGPVVWGSRTFRRADRLADGDWKYIHVRRLVLFLPPRRVPEELATRGVFREVRPQHNHPDGCKQRHRQRPNRPRAAQARRVPHPQIPTDGGAVAVLTSPKFNLPPNHGHPSSSRSRSPLQHRPHPIH